MQKFKTVKIETERLDSIICNCCGKELISYSHEMFGEHVNIRADFGYFAKIFFDGERHQLDVCEECYAKWIKTFKIAPEGFGYEFGYDGERDFEEWKGE